ncbi:hypothetical protein Rs2_35716 [Raphanus sativus]|nr:hypothetical protein Rs2_35716 [Raphanus sativus]
MEDVSAEDESDDADYDYNAWDDYVRNDCVTDDDDDFEEGPGKEKSGGHSGGKECLVNRRRVGIKDHVEVDLKQTKTIRSGDIQIVLPMEEAIIHQPPDRTLK